MLQMDEGKRRKSVAAVRGGTAAVRSPQEALGEVRAMPEDLASEAAVLGSMLLDPVCISEVIEKLKVEDFYRQEHRIIFEAVVALYEKNRGVGVDGVLLRSELGNYKRLDEAGGVEYLAKLMNTVPSSANVMYYAGDCQGQGAVARDGGGCG